MRKDRMENAGQIRWITGYEPQRALMIESLETIEQLPGDFEVRLHSQPHEHQLIHLLWASNSERCGSDASHGKIRLSSCTLWGAGALRRRLSGAGLSLPNGQTVLETPSKAPVVGDGTNHPGKAAAALDEIELFGLAGLVGRERAGNARRIPCWVQTRNGRGGTDPSRPTFEVLGPHGLSLSW